MSEYKKYIPLAILVILAGIVFLFAVQSNTAGNFYEFDPYMYMELTTLLAQHGSIPVSGLAYPCGASCSSNRFGVIIPYWLAGYLKLTNTAITLINPTASSWNIPPVTCWNIMLKLNSNTTALILATLLSKKAYSRIAISISIIGG